MPKTKKSSSWRLTRLSNNGNKTLHIFNLVYGLNSIGRSYDNQIVLDNESISRNHCQLWIEENDIPIIKDLGSKNGTFVQATMLEGVEDYILKENDIISLSSCEKGVTLVLSMERISSTFSNIEKEKPKTIRLDDIDDLKMNTTVTDNTSMTHPQEVNIMESATLYNHNDKNESETIIINKNNERIKDNDYYIQREQYATEWANNFLKILNSDNYETM